MASTSPGAQKPSTTTKRSTTSRKPAGAGTRTSRTTSTSRTASRTSRTIVERAVLVPVGAGLLARDNLVSTVKGLAGKYRTRTGMERELKRYERRGVTARDRFENQVRRGRMRFEREVRQRRSLVEKAVSQNRQRLDRELISVRRDFEKQSGAVSARVERLVTNAQGLIGS